MSVFMVIGGIASALVGVLAIVFGLPVKEFSFGNTLILAGAVGIVGGLIMVGLGAAIAQLQRVAELLGARPLSRNARNDSFEPPGTRLGQGVPFPPKPKSDSARRPGPDDGRFDDTHPAPSLHNPDVPVMAGAEAEEASLLPRQTPGVAARPPIEFPEPLKPMAPTARAPEPPAPSNAEAPWRSPPRASSPNYFDSMWPTETRAPKMPETAPSRAESIPRAPAMPKAPMPEKQRMGEPARAVAILKSGVVDGMGYTLYVDGSIEAELPDGTLRFASINDLRTHLEKNS